MVHQTIHIKIEITTNQDNNHIDGLVTTNLYLQSLLPAIIITQEVMCHIMINLALACHVMVNQVQVCHVMIDQVLVCQIMINQVQVHLIMINQVQAHHVTINQVLAHYMIGQVLVCHMMTITKNQEMLLVKGHTVIDQGIVYPVPDIKMSQVVVMTGKVGKGTDRGTDDLGVPAIVTATMTEVRLGIEKETIAIPMTDIDMIIRKEITDPKVQVIGIVEVTVVHMTAKMGGLDLITVNLIHVVEPGKSHLDLEAQLQNL